MDSLRSLGELRWTSSGIIARWRVDGNIVKQVVSGISYSVGGIISHLGPILETSLWPKVRVIRDITGTSRIEKRKIRYAARS